MPRGGNYCGAEVARTIVPRTVPDAFTATETLDVARDLGSPVSPAYVGHRSYGFEGHINQMRVRLK